MNGGTLEFEMGPKPSPKRYPTFIDPEPRNNSFVAVPVIDGGGERSFSGSKNISLSTAIKGAKIYFTTDSSEPTTNSQLYAEPFTIAASSTIKAIATTSNEKSMVAEAKFIKRPNNWTVKLESKYNRQYTGGGDEGLIDGIRGTVNFTSGEWQGYQPQDLVATFDLQKETTVSKVGGGFLQNARSWIWMPTHIEFEVSPDGVSFTKVADIKTEIGPEDMESKIRDYVQTISPVKARYVRVKAYNFGKIPAWHPGAGGDAFIFVDEIFIN
jgi:hypothetical protein